MIRSRAPAASCMTASACSTRSSALMPPWVSRWTEYTRSRSRPILMSAAVALRRCPRNTLAWGNGTRHALSILQRVSTAGPKNVSVTAWMVDGRKA